MDDQSKPEDFRRPGHVFPLISRKGGVLVRNGHTEATTDLMRLAGLKECGVCCEVMKEDGTMMRTSQLWEMAKEHNLTFITIRDLQDYIRIHEKHVKAKSEKKPKSAKRSGSRQSAQETKSSLELRMYS